MVTCSGWLSLSQVRVGGGTASDLHSSVTCLFSSTDTSWGVLSPAMLGGTDAQNQKKVKCLTASQCMHWRRKKTSKHFQFKIKFKVSSTRLYSGLWHLWVTHHELEPGTPCHHHLLDCWLSSCICLCPPAVDTKCGLTWPQRTIWPPEGAVRASEVFSGQNILRKVTFVQ